LLVELSLLNDDPKGVRIGALHRITVVTIHDANIEHSACNVLLAGRSARAQQSKQNQANEHGGRLLQGLGASK
jgi:hypothetical protein